MPALRALLDVYGALDHVARSSDSGYFRQSAYDLLRYSEPDGPDWHREISELFFPEEEYRPPNLVEALHQVNESAAGEPLTVPQRSRLLYALTAAKRIADVGRSTDTVIPDLDDMLHLTLSAVTETPHERLPDDLAGDFMTFVSENFAQPTHFDVVRARAAQMNLVVGDVTDVPICIAQTGHVNGQEVVIVDTFCKSQTVSLVNLKAVVNPFNWPTNYPDFFCRIDTCVPARTDGWGRMLEYVGFCGLSDYRLRTALKFLPREINPCEARLEYEMNDPPYEPGDGQVTVDRGFINMWALGTDPTAPGVRVRTRKVVHINELSPVAQQKLVCITGYGTASAEFLFGQAGNPPADAKPYTYLGDDPAAATASAAPPMNDHVVTTAIKAWTDAAEYSAQSYFNVAGKWLAGCLTMSDLAEHCQNVTGRFARTPWDVLQQATQPRQPDPTSGGGPA